MTTIPMILLRLKQRKIDQDLADLCSDDRSIPWRLRAQVLNQWRRIVRRKIWRTSEL